MEGRLGSVVGGCGSKGQGPPLCGLYPSSKGIKKGGVRYICFHPYALMIRWEGLVADWYWWRSGGALKCHNKRICISSCLHNEVK